MKAIKVIMKNYEIFKNDPVNGVSIGINEDDIFNWDVVIIGPKDSPYEGGLFTAKITFPENFPLMPPKFVFTNEIFHPNVYQDGKVCISILHPPGDDKWGYEKAEDRWRPVHTVNSIILSIILLLNSPNDESPANVDAGKIWREDRDLFQNRVNLCIRKSLKNI